MGTFEFELNAIYIMIWPRGHAGQWVEYGSLNENDHRLICLGTWSPVHGTAWKGLKGVVLLDKVCHRGRL